MKKIVKIQVQMTHTRIFNLLVDESADVPALEQKLDEILRDGYEDSFYFEENFRSVSFIGSDTLDTFPYRDGIANGVHKIVPHSMDVEYGDVLKEISRDDLVDEQE
jgi:hypothetical protein